MSVPSKLFDNVLKLEFIRGQSTVECDQELPHRCLSASRAGHEKEGTLARADGYSINGGHTVGHDGVSSYVCVHRFAWPASERIHVEELP